jgi:hypothetical protein
MRHLQRIRHAARRAASIAARRQRPSAMQLWPGLVTRPTSNVPNRLVDRGAGRRLGLVDSDSRVRRPAGKDVERVHGERDRSLVPNDVKLGRHLSKARPNADLRRRAVRADGAIQGALPLGHGDEGRAWVRMPARRPSRLNRRLLKRGVTWVRRVARDGSLDGVDLDLDRPRDNPTLRLDSDLPADGGDRGRSEGVVLFEGPPGDDRAREPCARRRGSSLVGKALGRR